MKNIQKTSRHLKIIQGQLSAIEKMILTEDLDCMKMLTQLKATQQSFRSLSQRIAQNVLEECFPGETCLNEGDLKKILDFTFTN
jgi:DNA-binding FrmR family transcriptional regulator